MYPVLLDLGSFQLHSYGALGALGFLLGAAVVLARARALGLDLNAVSDVIFWMAILGLVGARVAYVLVNPGEFATLVDLFDVRGGGLVFYGSLAVGVPLGFVLLRRRGLPVFATWDVFATGLPLGHAISRLGCFAAGCCYGAPTDGRWSVTYPTDSLIAPPGIPVHPVQLYEAAGLLAIAAATNLFYPRRRFDGQVLVVYLGAYAALRPLMELFRGDLTRGYFLEAVLGQRVSLSQGVSVLLATFVVGLAVWLARHPTFTGQPRPGS
jgi:phosphatidylglycerol---prolipoprotein diacylglyceryl transferase